MRIARIGLVALLFATACTVNTPQPAAIVHLSIVGTNDVHGMLNGEPGRAGLAGLSGYVNALRAARKADGGAVLLIDAGDMWQGTLESNLNEGAAVVDAYNAMDYTAAAIGNHEFDFGPEGPLSTPQSPDDDPLGNLKARAQQMKFPLLAANLTDRSTGALVDWDNVSPAVMIRVKGIRIGIIGVMTERALITTIASNVTGLDVEPLLTSVTREAEELRENGAQLVIVTAHAGSRCTEFDDPLDLASCDTGGEIMRLASGLPVGLVDHIVAGHVHQQIAHFVNGISITSGFSQTTSFGRTDLFVDRSNGHIVDHKVFAPQTPCPYWDFGGVCAWDQASGMSPAVYEGQLVMPDSDVVDIANRAFAVAEAKINEQIGPLLETPFNLDGNPESPLGNLFTDAVLQMSGGDVAIHNVSGGIRDTLPAGELTYGAVYNMFPFDNRVVRLEISGRELRQVIAHQVHRLRRRAGFSGMRVFVSCEADELDVRMVLADGTTIGDDDRIDLLINDFLALGGDDIMAPIMPADGFGSSEEYLPLTRDVLVDWFRLQGGYMHAMQFSSTDEPRWNLAADIPLSCTLATD